MSQARETRVEKDQQFASSPQFEIIATAAAYGLVALVAGVVSVAVRALDVFGLLRRR